MSRVINKKTGLTENQEGFCRSYVETNNASEAYRRNYSTKNMKPETVNRNAKTLIDNNKVAARINKLREKAAKRHEVTVDSLTKELEEARMLAFDIEQSSGAVSATMGKAKLHGLLVDKSKVEVAVKYTDLLDALDDE